MKNYDQDAYIDKKDLEQINNQIQLLIEKFNSFEKKFKRF